MIQLHNENCFIESSVNRLIDTKKEGLISALNFAFKDLPFTTGLGLRVITGITALGVSFSLIYRAETATLVIFIIARITTLLPTNSWVNLVVATGLIRHIITFSTTNPPQKPVFWLTLTARLCYRIIKRGSTRRQASCPIYNYPIAIYLLFEIETDSFADTPAKAIIHLTLAARLCTWIIATITTGNAALIRPDNGHRKQNHKRKNHSPYPDTEPFHTAYVHLPHLKKFLYQMHDGINQPGENEQGTLFHSP
jgi:hypothetical protein